jgi:hypothetical protein
MDELVKMNSDEIRDASKDADRIVVMDRDIDKAGTFLADVSIELFEKLVGIVATGVTKLHQSGVRRVRVATDHGFLLLPANYKPDTITIPAQPETVRGRRYAVGLPPQRESLVSFDFDGLGLHGNGRASFPRGLTMIAAESASDMFVHGGISLQENCIGFLTSVSEVETGKVGVEAEIPDSITSALFFVRLIPLKSSAPTGPRSITVRITDGGEIIAESKPLSIENEPQKVRMILHKLPPEVKVSVIDSDTQEILRTKKASVQLSGYDEEI